MWSLTDEALVAGLATGDSGAATAFVRRFQARVFGLAVTMVGDRAVAEEIAQEAFTRAWRHAAAYDARRGRVATWLLSITRNLAIDHLRAKRTEPLDPDSIGDAERA
ncbi:MAG: RNA polymerase sigma factor, partial [Solirubrobacterales bacterium]|nr:RNA polymerase sigma factor [Solirubrobacterales bacterium]